MVKRLTNPLSTRATPLGTVLSAAGRRLAADLDAALVAAGFDDIRAAHAPLFMAIDPAGSTATALAERAHMTKQAMGDLVRHLQQGGYVSVSVSSEDRRARTVKLTTKGWRALDAGLQVIADFDDWLSAEIGAAQVDALRAVLDRIITADWPAAAAASRSASTSTRRRRTRANPS